MDIRGLFSAILFFWGVVLFLFLKITLQGQSSDAVYSGDKQAC